MTLPTITTAQRNVLYEDILIRLTAIGDVLTVIEQDEFDKAQKLPTSSPTTCGYLRMILDGASCPRQ